MKVVAIVALLCVVVVSAGNIRTERPNFITDEEFAKIRGTSILISNTSSLPLPKFKPLAQPKPGFGPRLWTNGEVPYTLDPTFDESQREQVALAIQAFHDATCIRFVPKENHHTSWVDIEHYPDICGAAEMCMGQGAQFARFGGRCVNAGTMLHELGHTLCMGHEQTRRDRDEWISFYTPICEAHVMDGPEFDRGLHKLYDYLSVVHYEDECYSGCFQPKQPGIVRCGSGGPLSVLDIEVLNEMYGCNSGCQGYRYVNSNNQLNNPIPIGNDANGDQLYSCRAYHQGDIIPGKYHAGRRECHVGWQGGEHTKTGAHVEVLTNPNGVNFQWIQGGYLPANAVKGGRSNLRETLYVIRCEHPIDNGDRSIWIPGKYQPSAGPFTSFAGEEINCGNYQYLVCA